MAIDPKDAFTHLVYDYRYLAVAGCAWETVGPNGRQDDQKSANATIPGVGVLVQDSLFVHARSLIDFYTRVSTWPDDIMLSHFDNLSISQATKTKLVDYKKPIERHALHLTHSRDTQYRLNNPTTATDRPDWNSENTKLVLLLLDGLKEASTQQSTWQKPLSDLHVASVKRLNDKSFDWPTELTEASNIHAYLVSSGL